MLPPSLLSNWVLTPIQVTGSTIDGPHSAILMGGDGLVGSFDEGDTEGEKAHDMEAYGAPGLIFRPRPPEEVNTPAGPELLGFETMGARIGDGTAMLGGRDLRLNRRFPGPKPGTQALVGYGGGFLSFDDTTDDSGDEKATIATLYVPYLWSGGTHQKAMTFIVDPDLQAMSLIHGEGQAILLQDDGSVQMQSPSGDSWVRVEDGMITFQSPFIVLNGGAVVIGSPAGAVVPLAAGPASPPCPRLYLNPAA